MSWADVWAAVILGIVEGVTEFLPISSTGHLILAAELLGRDEAAIDTFIVVIQLGAILAVCWIYRQRLYGLLRSLHTRPTQHFAGRLLTAFMPAAVAGLLLHSHIKALFTPANVAYALIVGGIAIILIERRAPKVRVETIEEVGYREALLIGMAQTLALFPGVSRAAATIMGGRLCGLGRLPATEFSFFLAIPVMFAASGYDMYASWEQLRGSDLELIAIGFVIAFISAMAAVKWLLRFIATHDFKPFGWYRIALGAIVLLLLADF